MEIPIEISARHAHLSKQDLESVFGSGYQLNIDKELSQPGQFAAKERISLKNGEKIISNVRIVGPIREKTQVEISKTDARVLGIDPPVKLSGDLNSSVSITISGPEGKIGVQGVIISKRHFHCSDSTARKLGLEDGDELSVEIPGERGGVLHNVSVRVSKNFKDAIHLDTDEGNAMSIGPNNKARLLIK